MVFVVREPVSLGRPEFTRKVIKAKDFWTFKQAESLVADAHAQRDKILEDARAAYESERRRGFIEGTESARLEQSGHMVEFVTRTVEDLKRLEVELVDLVIDAVRKVVSDFDDSQRVAAVVRNCLDLVRSQKQLTIYVHPTQEANLRRQLDEIRLSYPSILEIDVHPDVRLADDACLVESAIGVVEASLQGQLAILSETFDKVFHRQKDAAVSVKPTEVEMVVENSHEDDHDGNQP